ncbi:MAG TPA: hypothetical protein EYO01_03805 [Phycisphaerales bacterium]|nr:hypothetical protein [Phycisphaerales bacterium]HIB50776.1 hypothetical protein [Phycisphaerales bacterium]HIO52131.1 hypothetical protein [Phycisphaerales bacterium]
MIEPENNFPIGFYREFLEKIDKLEIEVITYDDLFQECDDRDHESYFEEEFLTWKENRDPDKRYLLIQHDVDNSPRLTEEVVRLEMEFGVRSNIFIFASRWSLTENPAPYSVNHQFLQDAEQRGFVIGYHQNALQLSNFDVEEATKRFEADVYQLRKMYNINYVVPHGGKGTTVNGTVIHNKDLNIPESLRSSLRWVYNKYGMKFSHRISDGGLRKCTDVERLHQLNLTENFLPSIELGKRGFVLTHPQRWGTNVDPSFTPLLASLPWYKKMCKRHNVLPKSIKPPQSADI